MKSFSVPPLILSVLIFCLQSQEVHLFSTFISDCVFQQLPLGHAGAALITSQRHRCSSASELKQDEGRRRNMSPEELPGIIDIMLFCSPRAGHHGRIDLFLQVIIQNVYFVLFLCNGQIFAVQSNKWNETMNQYNSNA